ncbi:MAG: alpha/beta fold hydrolase [Minisyncoccota bacterium]
MAQFNFSQNDASDTLYVIMSGISGGKDESFVQYLFNAFKERDSVVSIQFANDPLYHNDALPDMNAMSMEDYFTCINEAIGMASQKRQLTHIILVAHSFSAVIATYYLNERKDVSLTAKPELITIDNDDSAAALIYIDSLSEDARKDKFQNPFSQSTTTYMRAHKSADVLFDLMLPKLHIDADEVGGDHEFQNDESKRLLVEKILAWRF